MTWLLIAVALVVVGLVAVVWRLQNRHPVPPGKPRDEVEKHFRGWGNTHSGGLL
ncbi:hypothetical protein GCM10009623_02330 [Nocardioides aestuarii]|uniref:Uncharacterized protein n=1 Tax=Nocardioides aestuarii TaxID=252231 RepID=A0ABW4TJB3_9ACTN